MREWTPVRCRLFCNGTYLVLLRTTPTSAGPAGDRFVARPSIVPTVPVDCSHSTVPTGRTYVRLNLASETVSQSVSQLEVSIVFTDPDERMVVQYVEETRSGADDAILLLAKNARARKAFLRIMQQDSFSTVQTVRTVDDNSRMVEKTKACSYLSIIEQINDETFLLLTTDNIHYIAFKHLSAVRSRSYHAAKIIKNTN